MNDDLTKQHINQMMMPYKDVSTSMMQLMRQTQLRAWFETDLATISGVATTTLPASPVRSFSQVQAAIIAMIDQVEADEQVRVAEAAKAQEAARPVMAAIEATHRAFRSDGRPHHYDDPLRKKA